MLSEAELNALREIEQRTAGHDPRFAAEMAAGLTARRYLSTRRGYDLVIALALALAVLCA